MSGVGDRSMVVEEVDVAVSSSQPGDSGDRRR
jgi:hypothetical protein